MSRLDLGPNFLFDSDYSTTEKKTGATWIDGKPIYRKVITGTFTPSSSNIGKETTVNIDNSITITDCTLVKMEGYMLGGNGTNVLYLGHSYYSSNGSIVLSSSLNLASYLNIQYYITSLPAWFSGTVSYTVIVYYVKN